MGKTVTTYLIDGTPQGPRYVFISNRSCKMYVIPRDNINVLTKREELQTPSLYILLGDNNQSYIGQTENFSERVRSHLANKSFWHTALVFISQNMAMTKSDVQYLEFLSIGKALELTTYSMTDNKVTPKEPHLPEHMIDSMKEFFGDIQFLVAFIGCRIFQKSTGFASKSKPKESCYQIISEGKGVDARMAIRNGKYVLLQGSVISSTFVSSYGGANKARRKEFINDHCKEVNGKITVKHDVEFDSPSGPSTIALGRSSNGNYDWKNEQGTRLQDVNV